MTSKREKMTKVNFTTCVDCKLCNRASVLYSYKLGSRVKYLLVTAPTTQVHPHKKLFRSHLMLGALTERKFATQGRFSTCGDCSLRSYHGHVVFMCANLTWIEMEIYFLPLYQNEVKISWIKVLPSCTGSITYLPRAKMSIMTFHLFFITSHN